MFGKNKQKQAIKEKKIQAADSTVKLITTELLDRLGLSLPLDQNSTDILAEYFETEEIGLAKDQAAHVPYDEQYMQDICRAVIDFYPSGDYDVLDIDDLNTRLQKA